MENFLWTVGEMLTKVLALITTIDDLFTDAVRDGMPMQRKNFLIMQQCFLSLHNTINEIAFENLKEKGFNNIRYLKSMGRFMQAYLLEAKWYYNSYTPSFQEYIENAWVSISAPVILVHAYFAVTNPITKESCDFLEAEYPNIIRCSSMILRLADDLGTSTDELERGDVPKSIQCYMNDTGVSEEDARNYVRSLISATWEKFNKERTVTSPFSKTYIEIAMNLGRMAQCMYQYGDGHGSAESETKDRVLALRFIPFLCLRILMDDHD
ncbi:hypothetical protein I3843_Q051400 [Carya illinoinensis]|nr:hypothetical protein I3843_Q051400 [Carya illinoinensis]